MKNLYPPFFIITFLLLLACGGQDSNDLTNEVVDETDQINEVIGEVEEIIIEKVTESKHITANRVKTISDRGYESELVWPELQGIKDAQIAQKLEASISFKNVVGRSKKEAIAEYKECSCGVYETSYNVNYDNNSILSISITIFYMGAYSSADFATFNLDLNTGKSIQIADIIPEKKVNDIVAQCNVVLQENIKRKAREYPDDFPESTFDEVFSAQDLENFTLTTNGILFQHYFDFIHAYKALEPDSRVSISYEVLGKHIQDEGFVVGMRSGDTEEEHFKPWHTDTKTDYSGVYHFGISEAEWNLIIAVSKGVVTAQQVSGSFGENAESWIWDYTNLKDVKIQGNKLNSVNDVGEFLISDLDGEDNVVYGFRFVPIESTDEESEIGFRQILVEDYLAGEYPEATYKVLEDQDIEGLSRKQLQIMRNEIFARYGYRFKPGGEMASYFNNQKWYTEEHDDVDAFLTEIENMNVRLIREKELSRQE